MVFKERHGFYKGEDYALTSTEGNFISSIKTMYAPAIPPYGIHLTIIFPWMQNYMYQDTFEANGKATDKPSTATCARAHIPMRWPRNTAGSDPVGNKIRNEQARKDKNVIPT